MSTILKAENISKQYRLGTVGTGTLSDDLKRWWYGVRGKEDPFLKVGAVNDRSSLANEDYVWALRNINFEVRQGEVLGIIGKNGAGKSTLLKLLSRVTSPTTGSIKTKGRIASLLEIGTGFHPELTGRENIFMNGAVLGMTKNEIKNKLDEIIAFSGCEKYIDTPVKRYSSGMTVRLGFAVAAHLEPEILVVDEVLAVGDAEFQKKAIGKMQDLSKGEGRTVLFVSHNMVSIQQLCSRTILLENGTIVFEGDTLKAVSRYLSNKELDKSNITFPLSIKQALLQNFFITNSEGNITSNLITGLGCSFNFQLKNEIEENIEFNIRIQLFDQGHELYTTLNTFHTNSTIIAMPQEELQFICSIDKLAISSGKYYIGVQITNLMTGDILFEDNNISTIQIINGDFFRSGKIPTSDNVGKIFTEFSWNQIKIK